MMIGDLSLGDLIYEEIYPHIFVYKNLFPDHQDLHRTLHESSNSANGQFLLGEWKPWFIFGSYAHPKDIHLLRHPIDYEALKKDFSFDGLFNSELYLSFRVNGSVFQALTHYIGLNKVKLPPKSFIEKPNYAKYQPDVTIGSKGSQELTMNYHTDYAIGEWFWENKNFLITATTYMNDNYDGGEISFFVNGDIISYKPEAGSIVVFPSDSPLYAPGKNPYFHGVHKVTGGSKYLIRSYVRYPQAGNDLWHKNLEKYGESEWRKIAEQMVKGHNMISFEHNDERVKKTYGNITIWQSPLVDFLYNNGAYDAVEEMYKDKIL